MTDRSAIQRNQRKLKRSAKRESDEGYVKRKLTNNKVCRYILFPVVLSSIGKPNDFYFHALSLQWNCKNIAKDYRCQALIRGLHLEDNVEIDNLARSKETGWFISARKNDLSKIGKVAGYFLRMFACSAGQALDENFTDFYSRIDVEDFNELMNEMKSKKTVVPSIVKLEISRDSDFDASKFVCLDEDHVKKLVNGNEIIATRRAKVLEISSDLQDWAWRLLNLETFERRRELLNDGVPITEDIIPVHNGILQKQAFDIVQPRAPSSRPKKPNTKYSDFIVKF